MAIAWLVAGGVHENMMKIAARARKFSFWTSPTDREIEPLALVHVMLSFIICVSGLSLALMVFVMERVLPKSDDTKSEFKGVNSMVMTARNRDNFLQTLIEL